MSRQPTLTGMIVSAESCERGVRLRLSTSLSSPLARVGVLGYGRMGALHATSIATCADAVLVAVCDRDPAALRRAASQHGIVTFEDVAAFLSSAMDAVIVASNSQWHADHVAAIADAGLHVFVEKPVALTFADTDRVLSCVQRAGVVFQVGFQRRWDQRYNRIKDVIDCGDIGEPVLLTAYGRDPNASRSGNWGLPKNGGLFFNCAIHDYDVVGYLLGRQPDRIAATGGLLVHRGLSQVGDLDLCATTLFFGSDAVATLEWNRFSPIGFDAGVEVIGTRGSVRLGRHADREPIVVSGRRSNGSVVDFFGEAYASSIAGFVRAVLSRQTSGPSIAEARAATQLAELAQRSFESGGVVTPVPPLAPLADTAEQPRDRTS